VAYVIGIPVLVFLVALVYGGLTGRVTMTSCCSIADPRRDLRMRAAFEDEDGARDRRDRERRPDPRGV
jgi:hypothetical protein